MVDFDEIEHDEAPRLLYVLISMMHRDFAARGG